MGLPVLAADGRGVTPDDRRRIESELSEIRRRIRLNRADLAAIDRLIDLCIVQLDDPAEARKYTFLLDATTRERVTLAARPIDDLSPAQCLHLGDWYAKLSQRAKGGAAAGMKRRARNYYRRFLAMHG
ncbi:MAG: hypothetical protein OER86_05820, partial [Phycisphaerae bacterium]|nr:hypothetical protein [Phycisphaerae bacterium]